MTGLCAAVGCNKRKVRGQPGYTGEASASAVLAKSRSFHMFPLGKPHLLKQWLHHLRRGAGFVPTKNDSLCFDHITPDCFDETQPMQVRDLFETRSLKL